MHILVKRSKPEATDVDVLVAPIWKTALALPDPVAQLDVHLGGVVRDYLDSGDFPGTLNSTLLLRSRGRKPLVSSSWVWAPLRPSRSITSGRRVPAPPRPCANWSQHTGYATTSL